MSSVESSILLRLSDRLKKPPTLAAPPEPFHVWVERHVMLNGQPFRFDGHEFLRDMYKDDHRFQVYEKASQVAMSTKAIAEACYYTSKVFTNGTIYFFPTDTDVSEFSKTRVKPFLQENPGLGGDLKDASVSLKRIGKSFLYLRGLKSTMKAKTVPADMLIFDELDEIPPRARKSAEQRISHSSFGFIRELSIPSIPEYGIDLNFQKSDQRYWILSCPACNADHCLEDEFPDCIVGTKDGDAIRACTKCGAELDLDRGRWVAKHPSRTDIRGYHLSQLFAPWVDPADIMEDFRTTQHLDVFYNETIGIPHVMAENQLKKEQVLSLCGAEPMVLDSYQGEVAFGVDQGKDLHCVLLAPAPGGAVRMLAAASFRDKDQLRLFLKKFNIICGVVDGLPETRLADEICSWFPGKVFRSFYISNARETVRWDENRMVLSTDRTAGLDKTFGTFRTKQIQLPRRCEEMEVLAEHFDHLKRKREQDVDTGEQWFEYVRTGPDHYAHATNYALHALRRHEVRHIEGATYKTLSNDHQVPHTPIHEIPGKFDVLFALVPHERLPWVAVWGITDKTGVVVILREREFVPASMKHVAQKLAAAEALDPRPPEERFLPKKFADHAVGQRELTFIEKLEDTGLTFITMDTPDDMAVMTVRNYLQYRPEVGMPGVVFTTEVPKCLDAIRMHRPGVDARTDMEEQAALYHQAVAMILLSDPSKREEDERHG